MLGTQLLGSSRKKAGKCIRALYCSMEVGRCVDVSKYISKYVCMYVCMNVCMYACMYVCTTM